MICKVLYRKRRKEKRRNNTEVTNLTEDHFGKYIEKSLEEIDNGNIDQVVKTDLITGTADRLLLSKLLILLRHLKILKNEEIVGIISEVRDSLEWHKEKLEEKYQARLVEIEAELTELNAQLKKIEDSEKQK
jgi:hypothetical protein